MNNPMLPFLEGLASLTRAILDNASQRNWMQVEHLEREQGPQEAHSSPKLSETALPASAAADLLSRTPHLSPDHLDASAPTPEILPPDAASPIDEIEALGQFINADKGRFEAIAGDLVQTGSAQVEAAPSSAQSSDNDWKAVPASSSQLPVSARTASSNAAAASIAHSLNSSGPLNAAQMLHELGRLLPPQDVSAFLETFRTLVVDIFARTQQEAGGPEDKQAAVRAALTLAHLAAVIDKDPRNPSTMRVLQDIAAVVLASSSPNDNTIFSGLAQTIGVGAGAKLALAIARDLADHDEDASRARSFLALALAGFARLGERIDEAHDAVLRHLGPLLIEWAGWRGQSERDAIEALIEFVNKRPELLENLGSRLDRLEQVGLEAFRAVRELSMLSFDAELRKVHRRFLSSQSVLASIAASRAALREIQYVTLAADDVQAGSTLEAIRLTLTHIGFDAPRSAFLADLSQIGRSTVMGANWTALESFTLIESQGRAFQRLLAFLNGQYVVATMPDIVSFDDRDMQFWNEPTASPSSKKRGVRS